MADRAERMNENSILYEVLVFSEWIQDFDNKNALNLLSSCPAPGTLLSPWRLLKKAQLQPDIRKVLQAESLWHMSVSQDGKVIAILQETLLEIRTAKDEYSSVVAKTSVPLSTHPQLRCMTWSPDSTFLAVALDSGAVNLYNLLGCNIASIPPVDLGYDGLSQPVVGLIFLQAKFKSTRWVGELLIVYLNGLVRSYLLPTFDGGTLEENAKFSLQSYYPSGVTSVAYHASHHVLIVAGPSDCYKNGISIWRLLTDHPFLKLAFDLPKSGASPRSILRYIPGFSSQDTSNTMIRMKISPHGDLLACLHCSGEISLWQLPSLRLHRSWSLVDQPGFPFQNVNRSSQVKGKTNFNPVEICWWSNMALVVVRRSGAISVCSLESLENLLGDSPEFLAGSAQIATVQGDRAGFIALECEVVNSSTRLDNSDEESQEESETSVLQASIQAALYSITDMEKFQPKPRRTPRLVQRTYRLLGMKSSTPEELYARKIENEDYKEALILARTYDLDCDLVYQRQWRNGNVSVDSIHKYLEKVRKKLWVAKECVERVPDSVAASRELLLFGLKITDVKPSSAESELDSEQLKLISFRKQILTFLDNLRIYEKIIGSADKYESVEFDALRRLPSIVAAVKYARQENWQAVSILLTYCGDQIIPHWLPILSNLPETLQPFQYRSLLPEVLGDEVVPWEVRRLRDPDWSEHHQYLTESKEEWIKLCNQHLYDSEPWLRQFEAQLLTPSLVEEWYQRRAYQIEQNTGLVDHALSFIKLAREKNVQNLDRLYFDLLTLESLVYTVRDESVSFSTLKQLSHLDQVKLILAKTDSATFVSDLRHLLVPFAARCEKLGCDTLYSLLRGLLLHLSETSLQLPLQLVKLLREDKKTKLSVWLCDGMTISLADTITLALDCIYTCPSDDQLDLCYQILESLPQRELESENEDLDSLHDRIDRLECYLEACEILDRYNIQKPVNFLFLNEDNVVVAKELLRTMAEYSVRETFPVEDLLTDLLTLGENVFRCLDADVCYEIFANALLFSECEEMIGSADIVLSCRKNDTEKKISFNRSVDLVLAAARDHFSRGSSLEDPCLKLAETCLRLIEEPHPAIHEELELLESVQLLGVFDVRILPLQVLLCLDRLELIEHCLKSKPDAYKSCQRLLQLAQTLRVCGEDRNSREGKVLAMVADFALAAQDLQYCSEVCGRLVSRNYSAAWTTVMKLGERRDFHNMTQKRLFLAFALLHCPVENVEDLVNCRVKSREPVFQTLPWPCFE